MTTATETPRIYVASLSDYNSGRLHGAWIDIAEGMTADDIHESVQTMLASSPEPIAEEWAIHDYELGGISINEYTSFDHVAAIAAGIHEHGDAFSAWAANDGYNLDHPENFQDQYQGEAESEEDYAREYVESTGMFDGVNDSVTNYFDYEAFARDLFMDGLWSAPNPSGGIYVFSN